MVTPRSRSTLHLQLGQEIIYLIMAVAVAAAFYMAVLRATDHRSQKDPPIIVMREADGYFFPTGSAILSTGFEQRLRREVVPRLAATGREYRATVIEVIGHTDEVPLRQSRRHETNLDRSLLPFLRDGSGEPVAADNVGLGMARAIAVAHVLRESPLREEFQIIPMSAGAFQRPNDTAALMGGTAIPDQARRRIEIRVRRQQVR
jgi:flagellar motor protein MotB